MPSFNFNPSKVKTYKEILRQPKKAKGNGKQDPTDGAQGVILQLVQETDGNFKAVDPYSIQPEIEGSAETPDIYMKMTMEKFHIDKRIYCDKNSTATFRLVVGPAQNKISEKVKPIFWVISAGMKLHELFSNNQGDRDQKMDINLDESFNGKPIEIPGGVVSIHLDVVKHRHPKWWKNLFNFLKDTVGKTVISAIGFPAVTGEAINIIDNTLNQIDRLKDREYIFSSTRTGILVSLTKWGDQKAEWFGATGDFSGSLGSLNPGVWIMIQTKDIPFFTKTPFYFDQVYGGLIPIGTTPLEAKAPDFVNPFDNTTFAVFKVDMVPTNLSVDFSKSTEKISDPSIA